MANEGLLLDTHIWFRLQVVPGRLRSGVVDAIEQAATRRRVFVSLISVWELAMLERDKRLELVGGVTRWTTEALASPGINLLAYSPAIAIESINLPQTMHKDPSDRIIVASARIERMTLVSADNAMLAFARTTGLAHLRA